MREEGLTGQTSKKLEMGGMSEVGLRMRVGGMKKKTKTGNHWESLARSGESTGSEETEKSDGDETEK